MTWRGVQTANPAAGTAGRTATGLRLASAAAAGIGTSIIAMIALASVRNSWSTIKVPYSAWPPWQIHLALPAGVAAVVLWLALLIGGLSLFAGLAALRRGAVLPVRWLIGVGLLAVVVFTLLPPAGSTDPFDYAAYGRMVLLGHTPYVFTPLQLSQLGDPIGKIAAQAGWASHVSLYGPIASFSELIAAKLGGLSIGRIILWLKVWNALAFAGVAFGLDRLLRTDPIRRCRAHLLWTANPLLLWMMMSSAHIDGLAVALGFGGLIAVSGRRIFGSSRTDGRFGPPSWRSALLSGVLIGTSADIKADYLLFGLAAIWACRRSLKALISEFAGVAVVLVPTYVWYGPPAMNALLNRTGFATADSYYHVFTNIGWLTWTGKHQISGSWVPTVIIVGLSILLLWRLPKPLPGLPAVQPALALALAWLFIWPYQMPWYDVMILCLLALYPASQLDYLVLFRLMVGTMALSPGNKILPFQPGVSAASHVIIDQLTPVVLLACAVGLIWLTVSGDWRMDLTPTTTTRTAKAMTPVRT